MLPGYTRIGDSNFVRRLSTQADWFIRYLKFAKDIFAIHVVDLRHFAFSSPDGTGSIAFCGDDIRKKRPLSTSLVVAAHDSENGRAGNSVEPPDGIATYHSSEGTGYKENRPQSAPRTQRMK